MARKRQPQDEKDPFKKLQNEDIEDDFGEWEEERDKRDSGLSRHRYKDRDKRSLEDE